jgi:hypothetical protein
VVCAASKFRRFIVPGPSSLTVIRDSRSKIDDKAYFVYFQNLVKLFQKFG